MKRFLGDAGHVVRLVVLLALAVVAFLVLRQLVVTPGFGQYGHYRPQALAANRNHPLVHAGREACLACHRVGDGDVAVERPVADITKNVAQPTGGHGSIERRGCFVR